MKIYGVNKEGLGDSEQKSREELNNVRKIESFLDEYGVCVTFENGETKWFEYIEVA